MKNKKSFHMLIAMVVLALTASALLATASAVPLGEVLYLADNTGIGDGTSTIFRVYVDQVDGKANLQMVGKVPYDNALAIACTPDGNKIYVFDSYNTAYPSWGTGRMGYLDVSSGTFHDLAQATYNSSVLPAIVLAGFSPGGTLYVASEDTDDVYTMNPTTGVASRIGPVVVNMGQANETVVHERGADMAFTAAGTPYIWTNTANGTNAPSGLYELTLPAVNGKISAAFVGSMPNDFFTGDAIRANGFGDLTGSSHDGHIHVQSLTSAADVGGSPYPMYLDGQPYAYSYGDMSNGPLGILCTRTIGYYKNHDWNYGSPDFPAAAIICGIPITQYGTQTAPSGQDFLNGVGYAKKPNGTDFSMLIAQLIAAELNTSDSSGIPLIDEAENWLCSQGIVENDQIDFHKQFTDAHQAAMANYYASLLDKFNNQYEPYCSSINTCTPHLQRTGRHH